MMQSGSVQIKIVQRKAKELVTFDGPYMLRTSLTVSDTDCLVC